MISFIVGIPALVGGTALLWLAPAGPGRWVALLVLAAATLLAVLLARRPPADEHQPDICLCPRSDCARAEQERDRLAHELHDEIGQCISVLRLDLGWLERRVEPLGDEGRAHLRAMRHVLDATATSLRQITADLETAVTPVDELGLVPAIEQVADTLRRCSPLKVQVAATEGLHELPRPVANAAYRVVQEALTNTLRHAQATEVAVVLSREADALRLKVQDNGRGFHAHALPAGTRGLRGMQVRVEDVGGCFTLVSTPGQGTTVSAALPLAFVSR